MKRRTQIPEIAEVVQLWMPEATDNELKEASVNLRRYLAVIYGSTLRLESEENFEPANDKSQPTDIVSG